MNIVKPLDRQHARRIELASSQIRPARCRYFVFSDGLGASQIVAEGGAVPFDTYFVEEPTFSWGARITRSPGADEGDEIEYLPMAAAYVLNYKINDLDLYTAADIYLRTWHPLEATHSSEIDPAAYAFKFSLTFEGFALRTTSKIV